MRAMFGLVALVLVALSGQVSAEPRDANDRGLGAEMNRERAESRIERLRRERQQKEDAAPSRNERPEPRQERQPRGTRNF